MKHLTKYALVQFMPFVETGEFANVGVLLCAPETGYWHFQLAAPRFARVTNFFEEMEKHVYAAAIKNFGEELLLIGNQAATYKNKKLVDFFDETTRQRQALLRFSTPRVLLCENPEQELDALFKRFVHRDFVTKQYREDQMVRALKKQIGTLHEGPKFTERRIQAGFRQFQVPLASEVGNKLRLIKPLAFDQLTATDLYEHGEKWRNRFDAVVKQDLADAKDILLPVDKKQAGISGERKQAFNTIIAELKDVGFQVVDFAETNKIIRFATDLH